jgi:hypothetical protein
MRFSRKQHSQVKFHFKFKISNFQDCGLRTGLSCSRRHCKRDSDHHLALWFPPSAPFSFRLSFTDALHPIAQLRNIICDLTVTPCAVTRCDTGRTEHMPFTLHCMATTNRSHEPKPSKTKKTIPETISHLNTEAVPISTSCIPTTTTSVPSRVKSLHACMNMKCFRHQHPGSEPVGFR